MAWNCEAAQTGGNRWRYLQEVRSEGDPPGLNGDTIDQFQLSDTAANWHTAQLLGVNNYPWRSGFGPPDKTNSLGYQDTEIAL